MTSEKKIVLISVPSGEGSTRTWERIGDGISSLTVSNNGQVDTKQYINDSFATSKRTGLQKQLAFSGEYVEGNKVIDYFIGLSEKVGKDVETEIAVFTLKAGETSPTVGSYDGKMYHAIVDVSNDGSLEGGAEISIDGTIYINGSPVESTITVAGSTGKPTFTVSDKT